MSSVRLWLPESYWRREEAVRARGGVVAVTGSDVGITPVTGSQVPDLASALVIETAALGRCRDETLAELEVLVGFDNKPRARLPDHAPATWFAPQDRADELVRGLLRSTHPRDLTSANCTN